MLSIKVLSGFSSPKWAVTLTILCFFLVSSTSSLAQGLSLSVKRFGNEPVEFHGLTVKENQKDKSVKFGEALTSDDSDIKWLKNASFNLRSNSRKTIVGVAVDIVFEAANSDTPYSNTIMRGGVDKQLGANLPSEILNVEFGDSLRFDISTERNQGILNFLTKLYGSNFKLKKISLSPQFIIFSDDTMWSYGFNFKRDPDSKERWLIDSSENVTPEKISYSPNILNTRAKCLTLAETKKASISPVSLSKKTAPPAFVTCWYPTSASVASCGSNGLVNCKIFNMNFGEAARGIF